MRAAAARVIGRLRIPGAGHALITAMNDSRPEVRHESMRALGALGDATAVQALGDQLNYHRKGEGARAALDGLARLAHPASVPQFEERLTDRDPWLRRAAAEGLGRVGHAAAVDALRAGAAGDDEEMVRAAMVFALVKIGQERAARLADFLDGRSVAPQVQGYLLELGSAAVGELAPRLLEPDEQVRRRVAEALGAIGDASTIPTLTPLLQDRDREVVKAAGRAIERIKQRAEGPRT
jgi:HEAT repeat protein